MEKKLAIPKLTVRVFDQEDEEGSGAPHLLRASFRIAIDLITKEAPHIRVVAEAGEPRCITLQAFPQHVPHLLEMLRKRNIGRIVTISE